MQNSESCATQPASTHLSHGSQGSGFPLEGHGITVPDPLQFLAHEPDSSTTDLSMIHRMQSGRVFIACRVSPIARVSQIAAPFKLPCRLRNPTNLLPACFVPPLRPPVSRLSIHLPHVPDAGVSRVRFSSDGR